MATLTAINIISFLLIFLVLIRIMRNMAKIKKQNDMIYYRKLRENQLMDKCKRIAEETDKEIRDLEFEDTEPFMYPDITSHDFEFKDTAIEGIDMSLRLRKCLNSFLREHGIAENLNHVALFSKKDILFNCKNMGKKSMDELETLMKKYNLKFKENGNK